MRVSNPRRPISRSGSRTVDRLGAVIAATAMSSKPATDTSAGTSMPSSASRWSAPSASRSLAQRDGAEWRVAGEQHVDAEGAALAVEARVDHEPLVERDPRARRAPDGSRPAAARATNSDGDRRGTRSGDGPCADQRRDHRRDPRFVVDADFGSPAARAARGGRPPRRRRASPPGASVDLALSSGLSSPLAGEDHARGPHRAEQADIRRLALGVALGAAGDDQVAAADAASSTPRTTSAKYGSVMSWTMTADHRDVALEQPARERVGDVVERPGRVEHPLPRGRADRVIRRGDDARRCRGRHAREPGDLGDRRHQNGNVGGSSRTVTHCHSVKLSRFASPP